MPCTGIFNGSDSHDTTLPIEWKLKLEQNSVGDFSLVAVTPEGEKVYYGNLLNLVTTGPRSDQGLRLYNRVNPNLGIPLDGDGRLKIIYNDD